MTLNLNTNNDARKQYIANCIVEKAIYKPTANEFMFGKSVGARYASQFYLSNCVYDPVFLEYVSYWFVDYYGDELSNNAIQITGREWSALPLLSVIVLHVKKHMNFNLNAFMIRRKRKIYGKHNYIEGIPNDKKVVIIDDLCNSTNSFLHCRLVCESIDLEVHENHFAILNKYSRKEFGDAMEYDRFSKQKCYYIIERDELNAITRR